MLKKLKFGKKNFQGIRQIFTAFFCPSITAQLPMVMPLLFFFRIKEPGLYLLLRLLFLSVYFLLFFIIFFVFLGCIF